jgi:hypothetical protein
MVGIMIDKMVGIIYFSYLKYSDNWFLNFINGVKKTSNDNEISMPYSYFACVPTLYTCNQKCDYH